MLDNIEPGAQVWLNPSLTAQAEQPNWQAKSLHVNVLPQEFDANKERAVVAALDFVEKQSKDPDIFIEYP
ncbi:hypothetical protein [Methylophaga sp. OBS3]|uniref:hypothetical protein n=1 Tax=Methylophaga sp. OBS3 TaxID=2991934 RepID=UPI0022510FDD|nr:hypothetical protein [Methylophaga sp. OBS3]MCX4188708.1 hypothetical protein [Methylophaga sp. OBS3]